MEGLAMFSTVGIATPKEFLDHVVDPDMADFANTTGTELRSAYHACVSLLSLRDWVGQAHHGKAWTYQGSPKGRIDKKKLKSGLGAGLVAIDDAFAKVFDIANASKHMVLDSGKKLTKLHGSANVHIQMTGGSKLGQAELGNLILDSPGNPNVFVQIGTQFYAVLPLATQVHSIWKTLFAENGW
jgi:hypothetical protein